MPSPKRTAFERERDLQLTTAMYLDGKTQYEIAKVIGVAQYQICYDLKEVKKRWLASSLRDFDELKSEELARLDRLEVTYREAWVRSCQAKKKLVKDTSPKYTRKQAIVEDSLGNPAYLDGIHKCIMARCKILGLVDVKVKAELTGADGGPIKVEHQTVEERVKIAHSILAGCNLGGDGASQPIYPEDAPSEGSGVSRPL